jgi:hypothetical protein
MPDEDDLEDGMIADDMALDDLQTGLEGRL